MLWVRITVWLCMVCECFFFVRSFCVCLCLCVKNSCFLIELLCDAAWFGFAVLFWVLLCCCLKHVCVCVKCGCVCCCMVCVLCVMRCVLKVLL